jgi:hypothetical protein
LKRKLEPVAEAGRPFRAIARELLALSAWGHQDYAQARHYIEAIMGDAETSPAMRGRVELLAALIAGTAKPADKPAEKSDGKPAAKTDGKS